MRCLIIALVFLMAGCSASVPQSSAVPVPVAIPVNDRDDDVLVYVYRPNTMIGKLNFDVPFIHLDGNLLTRMRIGGYLSKRVAPGSYRLSTTESLLGRDTGRVRGETVFEAGPGSTVYLRYTESFKSITPLVLPNVIIVSSTGQFRFELVDESTALQELTRTSPLMVSD